MLSITFEPRPSGSGAASFLLSLVRCDDEGDTEHRVKGDWASESPGGGKPAANLEHPPVFLDE